MLRESFADVLCGGRVENFCKALFANVAECNLSAMVKATGDNATVMKNCDVCVKCSACACNNFAAGSFDVASIDAMLRMIQGL